MYQNTCEKDSTLTGCEEIEVVTTNFQGNAIEPKKICNRCQTDSKLGYFAQSEVLDKDLRKRSMVCFDAARVNQDNGPTDNPTTKPTPTTPNNSQNQSSIILHSLQIVIVMVVSIFCF